jgi:hypothetical protein
MNTADMVTIFKIRQDWFETPMGSYPYRAEAEKAVLACDLPKEVIVHRVEMTPISELIKAVNQHMIAMKIEPEDYSFCLSPCLFDDRTATIPQYHRYLIAYAIEGGSEGYYVHIGALMPGEKTEQQYIDFGFCKTYSSESAYNIAREAQRFLTAAAWN